MKRLVLVVFFAAVVAVFGSINVLAEENDHVEHGSHYVDSNSGSGGGGGSGEGGSIVGSITG